VQGIGAGAVGRDAARAGGCRTAGLGLIFHYVVAFGIAAIYVVASRVVPMLARRPLICGPIFGVGAYFFMNLVVIPLSRIGPQPFTTGPFINGILIHAIGIGTPVALIASRCYRIRSAGCGWCRSDRESG